MSLGRVRPAVQAARAIQTMWSNEKLCGRRIHSSLLGFDGPFLTHSLNLIGVRWFSFTTSLKTNQKQTWYAARPWAAFFGGASMDGHLHPTYKICGRRIHSTTIGVRLSVSDVHSTCLGFMVQHTTYLENKTKQTNTKKSLVNLREWIPRGAILGEVADTCTQT